MSLAGTRSVSPDAFQSESAAHQAGWLLSQTFWYPSSWCAPMLSAGADRSTHNQWTCRFYYLMRGHSKGPSSGSQFLFWTGSYGWSSRLWAAEGSLLAGRIGSRVTLAVGWTCGSVILTRRIARIGDLGSVLFKIDIFWTFLTRFQIILLIDCLNIFGQLGLWGKKPQTTKTRFLFFFFFLNEHPLLE